MKKKWLTTVVTALCLALVASLFTACGKKQVKIELSQTTLELIVGGGLRSLLQRLTART